MKHFLASLACCAVFASNASAQLSDYLGPGILTGGADNIGNRAGEQVDIRFYVSLLAIYDNGIQPVSVDSKGDLLQVNGLFGTELAFGAYGVHNWRTAQLGLDYRGDLRDYPGDTSYDGSDQTLSLGYTYQKSKRLYFNLQGVGGTYSNYLGAIAGETEATSTNTVNTPTLLLFDDRTYFLQGNVGMTYLLSARASLTVGGDGFMVRYQSGALVNTFGYGARASFRYRLTRTTSIGAQYQRQQFQYPGAFGQSDINSYHLLLSTQLGRLWTFSLSGGMDQVNATGLQTVTLAPAIAALLGVTTTVHTYAASSWVPSGQASLLRKFKNATLSFGYSRLILPGDGVYLTSRSENALVGYNYTGLRKVSLGINAGYSSLVSVGQGIAPYSQVVGSASMTYNLTHALHAVARYDLRHQEIELAGYRRDSFRATLGIAFSPGALPLSLW